ncbi:MAG: disulfide bond formation protein B [Alphaproteobacteria bacterium]
MSPVRLLTILFSIGCFGLFGASIALEVWGEFSSCVLCKVERFFFLGGGMFAGLTCFMGDRKLLLSLKFLSVVWFGGAGVALYHTAVQQHWVEIPSFCRVQEPAGETVEEMAENLLKLRHIPCDQITLSLGGIPAPVYLIFLMTILGVICWNMGCVSRLLCRSKGCS